MPRLATFGYVFLALFLSISCQFHNSELNDDDISKARPADRSILPDTLRSQFSNASDSEVYDSLFGKILKFADSDNELALFYCLQLKGFAEKLGDTVKIVESHRIAGQIYRRLNRMDQALKELNDALAIAKRNNFEKDLAVIYNALGITYTYRSKYDDALKNHLAALDLKRKIGDKHQLSVSLHNIGFVYFYLEDYNTALAYYRESLDLKKEIDSSFDRDMLYINISSCYRKLGRLDRALETTDSAFFICNSNCTKKIIMLGEVSYGSIYFLQKEFHTAKKHLSRSYSLAIKLDDKSLQVENLHLLAQLEQIQGNSKQAEELFFRGLKLAISAQYGVMVMNNYFQLTKLYQSKNDYENASSCQTKYIEIRDSIYSNQVRNKVAALQLEAKVKNDQLIIAHKEEIINKAQTEKFLTFTILILLIVVMIALLKILRNKHKIQTLLDLKVTERTKELEKNRIALEQSIKFQTTILQKTLRDIKAPLARIRGVSEIALNEITNQDERIYFEKIETAITDLTTIVEKNSTTREKV
jgi:tetratricopeptide (TPR) repeat protein